MTRIFALLFATGCGLTATPDAPPPVEDAPARVQALRLDLHAVQQAWGEGRREEARAGLRAAYADRFEPMEPALRTLDPVATLELEYAFGALERRLRRGGDALAVAEAVQAITRGTDALVAQLPQPEGAPAEAPPSLGTPRAEAATLPPHLQGDAG